MTTGPARAGAARRGLDLDEVTVRFGTATALDAVTLDVAPGEVVTLLGPSGCGKSTLLRVVAGLQPVDAGTVRWAGADLAGVPVHRRGFGLMFQEGQLFVHRDVGGNVAFGLEVAHVPRAGRRARVAELLDLVGLGGYERRAVATLSGGEQQRVALARALAPRPRLLLLDEPLSALDRALRERLVGELASILRRAGTTALYVTHDHDEAFAVADRVAVLDRGRLLQVDAPDRLWRAPRSRTVAEFLGFEAFLPVAADDGHRLLAIAPGALRVVGPAAAGGGTAVAGGADGGGATVAGGPVSLTGVLLGRRVRRGGTQVDVRLVGGGTAAAAVEDGARVPEPGTELALSLDPAGAVVVPAD